MRIAVAQIDPTVGDIDGNETLIRQAMRAAADTGADMLVTPELSLCGYPPEDLLLRSDFIGDQAAALVRLAAEAGPCATLVGYAARVIPATSFDAAPRMLHNAVAVLRDGRVEACFSKRLLPDYGVFDETRWFGPGTLEPHVVDVAGKRVGVIVCEDLWDPAVVDVTGNAGVDLFVSVNASPWHTGKHAERVWHAVGAARRHNAPVLYCNQVGGQDGIVFDGRSFYANARGASWVAPAWETGLHVVDTDQLEETTVVVDDTGPAETWAALVTGVRDYITKNRFSRVWIGLSGGIDSAVTAAVAVDALGPEHVTGVLMPSDVSSAGSVDDAADLAARLRIDTHVLPIAAMNTAALDVLHDAGGFAGTTVDVAEQNIQARIRGLFLMAMSNKHGGIVLTTGNKSELAVGYCTLYGDMAGGFAVLADIPKTVVYELAAWRNLAADAPIPTATITKAPSAELAPGQADTDNLPPYDQLDAILDAYIDRDETLPVITAEIVAKFGLDEADAEDLIDRVTRMVDRAEYKRRQAAPGIRVSRKAFGRERRLPITNAYTPAR